MNLKIQNLPRRLAEFRQAGHEVITIEKEAGKTVKGKKGEASVTIDKAIDDVRPDEFDALLLPGGHSPDYLRGDSRFVDFTRDFVNSGKPVFAICHGPQLLISADVIRGRKLTAVKPIIIDVKNAGAEFYDQEVVVDKDQLVTSARLTTCRHLTARRYACWARESRNQCSFLPNPACCR
ncbi:General stress protein 18 [Salmonella enterica subsp. enterica]|uniref:General stress protein 18 n=1 Tax=Salmonella enterica I TaxID=59201 RepID=A0A379W256_SALET|nr:General stress protein 18 [Salmonella enterica subsp. enterica]